MYYSRNIRLQPQEVLLPNTIVHKSGESFSLKTQSSLLESLLSLFIFAADRKSPNWLFPSTSSKGQSYPCLLEPVSLLFCHYLVGNKHTHIHMYTLNKYREALYHFWVLILLCSELSLPNDLLVCLAHSSASRRASLFSLIRRKSYSNLQHLQHIFDIRIQAFQSDIADKNNWWDWRSYFCKETVSRDFLSSVFSWIKST
jgi:hypothetical protein